MGRNTFENAVKRHLSYLANLQNPTIDGTLVTSIHKCYKKMNLEEKLDGLMEDIAVIISLINQFPWKRFPHSLRTM